MSTDRWDSEVVWLAHLPTSEVEAKPRRWTAARVAYNQSMYDNNANECLCGDSI